MHVLPSSFTHKLPNCTLSPLYLIYFIIVSLPNLVTKHGQCSAHAHTHPKSKPKYLAQRNFKNVDLDKLLFDAALIDWTSVIITATVDDKIKYFNEKIIQLCDKHAPVRLIKLKRCPAQWLSDELKCL